MQIRMLHQVRSPLANLLELGNISISINYFLVYLILPSTLMGFSSLFLVGVLEATVMFITTVGVAVDI